MFSSYSYKVFSNFSVNKNRVLGLKNNLNNRNFITSDFLDRKSRSRVDNKFSVVIMVLMTMIVIKLTILNGSK
jgi:hypothetical protein